MGVILAKFRKEKTTYQLLERLEEKIKSIEEFSISTQQRQKRFVGNFLVISIGLYVLAFAVFYFAFFPPTWVQRVAYITPMLIFPFVILFLKRLFAWYYERKLSKNSTQLNGLRAEKRKIIEKVMDKETYKVAIDILQRFGDSSTTPSSGHHQHAGMATLEEYEYSAFRCAFCKTLNPARKLRPISPRIPGSTEDLAQELKHESSDTSSGSDSEATVDVGSKMPTSGAVATESSSDAEKPSGEKKND